MSNEKSNIGNSGKKISIVKKKTIAPKPKNGRHKYTYADGATYDGDWKDGMRHGHGLCIWQNGSKYDGEWKDDKRHGRGLNTHHNGGIYNGEWISGLAHGFGVYTDKGGRIYNGQWKADERHGSGVYIPLDANGGRFHGKWYTNMIYAGVFIFHEKGVFYLPAPDWDSWTNTSPLIDRGHANWLNDPSIMRFNGDLTGGESLCHLQYPDKSIDESEMYIGCCSYGKPHGKGTKIWRNGNKYMGDFVNGELQGFGQVLYPNGDTYDGNFENSERHGKGKFVCKCEKDSTIMYDGDWKNGKRNGEGKQIWTGSAFLEEGVYTGKWKDDKREGEGKFELAKARSELPDVCASIFCRSYSGGWKNDRPFGEGVHVMTSVGRRVLKHSSVEYPRITAVWDNEGSCVEGKYNYAM